MTLIDTNTPVSVAVQAHRLRELADLLEQTAAHLTTTGRTGLRVFVNLHIGGYDQGSEMARVAVVDELAGLLGITAEPTSSGSTWSHEASNNTDQLRVRVTTWIEAPPRHCVCGARCTHGGAR
jgi:hypothetical protein